MIIEVDNDEVRIQDITRKSQLVEELMRMGLTEDEAIDALEEDDVLDELFNED